MTIDDNVLHHSLIEPCPFCRDLRSRLSLLEKALGPMVEAIFKHTHTTGCFTDLVELAISARAALSQSEPSSSTLVQPGSSELRSTR